MAISDCRRRGGRTIARRQLKGVDSPLSWNVQTGGEKRNERTDAQ